MNGENEFDSATLAPEQVWIIQAERGAAREANLDTGKLLLISCQTLPDLGMISRQKRSAQQDESLYIRMLEELGYVPVSFTSGIAALAAFREDPARFDAMITDERMPHISGCALVSEVRRFHRGMPILLMSGYVGGGLMERALEAGADDVLKKPLSAHDLARGLARVMRK